MKEPILYVNGRFVAESHASVRVSDLGLLRAYGVFDFTRTYDREPFRLMDHLERLERSASAIELDLPWSRKELTELVYRTLEKNPNGEKGIRIIVTGGESSDSFIPASKPNLIIIAKPIHIYPKRFFNGGVKIITFPGKREIPETKTLNYAQAIQALKRARQNGAEEALYTQNGVVSECTVCSFFAVKDRTIITAGKDIVDGITRKTILELIRGRMPVEYRLVAISEIPSLDEAFFTSSSHEVVPVVQIDQIRIGDGKPGPITQEVMRMFREYTRKSKS
jgi:branched-chain amino acid aminotransferase